MNSRKRVAITYGRNRRRQIQANSFHEDDEDISLGGSSDPAPLNKEDEPELKQQDKAHLSNETELADTASMPGRRQRRNVKEKGKEEDLFDFGSFESQITASKPTRRLTTKPKPQLSKPATQRKKQPEGQNNKQQEDPTPSFQPPSIPRVPSLSRMNSDDADKMLLSSPEHKEETVERVKLDCPLEESTGDPHYDESSPPKRRTLLASSSRKQDREPTDDSQELDLFGFSVMPAEATTSKNTNAKKKISSEKAAKSTAKLSSNSQREDLVSDVAEPMDVVLPSKKTGSTTANKPISKNKTIPKPKAALKASGSGASIEGAHAQNTTLPRMTRSTRQNPPTNARNSDSSTSCEDNLSSDSPKPARATSKRNPAPAVTEDVSTAVDSKSTTAAVIPELDGFLNSIAAADVPRRSKANRVARMKSAHSPTLKKSNSLDTGLEDIFQAQASVSTTTLHGVTSNNTTAATSTTNVFTKRLEKSLSQTDNLFEPEPGVFGTLQHQNVVGRLFGEEAGPSYASMQETSTATALSSNTYAGGPITYGRSRSFLSSQPDLLSEPFVSLTRQLREQGLDSSDDEDDHKKEVKSIHELREAGETKRFTDEMEYILDGLRDDQPLSVKRSSCLEFANKIMSGAFLMKVRAHDFVPRVYESLHLEVDPVMVICTTFILCCLMQDRKNVDFFVQQDDGMDLIARCFALNPDPLVNAPRSKYEKRLVKDVKDVLQSSPLFSNHAEKITAPFIAMSCLALIASSKQRGEDFVKMRMHRAVRPLTDLLGGSFADAERSCKTLKAERDSYDTARLPVSIDFAGVERCLGVLEFATLSCRPNQMAVLERDGFLEGMLNLLRFCEVVARSDPPKAYQASDCLLAILKVLINLTNDHEGCADFLGQEESLTALLRLAIIPNPHLDVPTDLSITAEKNKNEVSGDGVGLEVKETGKGKSDPKRPAKDAKKKKGRKADAAGVENKEGLGGDGFDVDMEDVAEGIARESISKSCTTTATVAAEGQQHNHQGEETSTKVTNFDVELLSVGLLINAVEVFAENRNRVRLHFLSDKCTAVGECLLECKCQEKRDTIACLVDIFSSRISESQTETKVSAAYLAVFLGCLVRDNPINRRTIRARLPNGSFDTLVRLLEEFIQFNAIVAMQANAEQE
ncbi:hypothetical protein HK102_014211, partial [Quaeritorhiza haematococci]